MPFTAEDIEAMPPAVRAEIQEWIARRYLALRTPRPDLCPRRDLRVKDRRRSVRETLDPPTVWPRYWNVNNDPISAHFRRLRSAIPRG